MKKQKNLKNQKVLNGKQSEFSHEELIKALYWTFDVFDRANMNHFLVYKTAEDVLQKKHLEGNGIYIGVRLNEWLSGSKNIVDSFAQPVEETEDYIKYEFEKIPVYLYIFDDDPCIVSLNQIMYEREYFKLPNPYSGFMDRFGARP